MPRALQSRHPQHKKTTRSPLTRRAFTLIELLIVVVILALLIGTVRYIFRDDLRRRTQAQTCVNEIHAMLSQQLNAAVSSKDVYNGSTRHTPTSYIIDFNTTAWTDDANYKTQPDTNATITVSAEIGETHPLVINSIQHNAINDTIPPCANKDQYFVGIQQNVGNTDNLIKTVTIQQWLAADNTKNAMEIKTTDNRTLRTAEVQFAYCYPNVDGVPIRCSPLSKIVFDARTARISKVDCNARNPTNDTTCTTRADENAG